MSNVIGNSFEELSYSEMMNVHGGKKKTTVVTTKLFCLGVTILVSVTINL